MDRISNYSFEAEEIIHKITKEIESFKNLPNYFNKTIFMYWDKGYNNLNDMCKIGIKLIQKMNPEYELIFITNDNINNYFTYYEDLYKYSTLEYSPQLFSDILRTYLITKYGGIWLDCASFVTRPFRENLEKIMVNNKTYFYMFGVIHHFMSPGLMASKSNNYEFGIIIPELFKFSLKRREVPLKRTNELPDFFITNYDELYECYEKRMKFPYFLYSYIINISTINNVINISNVFLQNILIKKKTESLAGFIGVHFNKRRDYNDIKILDANENIIIENLENLENLEKYKFDTIIKNLI